MKILGIFIKNLNSLAGEHTIDFTVKPLSNAALFAITGPTGAGKSTILDAICLALYDYSPRINKASKSAIEQSGALISRGCLETEAMVEYEQSDKKYRSRWSIKYASTGALSERQMELSYFDVDANTWPVISSKFSEVPIKNGEITKLDYGQFTRSILLAQGEFAKLLTAKKEERYALMEKITGDDLYRRIGKRTYEKASKLQAEINLLEADMKGITFLKEEERSDINTQLANIEIELSQKNKELKEITDLLNVKKSRAKKQEDKKATELKFASWKSHSDAFQPNLIRLDRFEKARPVFAKLFQLQEHKNQYLIKFNSCKAEEKNIAVLEQNIKPKLALWSETLKLNLTEDNFTTLFTKELNNIAEKQEKKRQTDSDFENALKEWENEKTRFTNNTKELDITKKQIKIKNEEIEKITASLLILQPLQDSFNHLDGWVVQENGLRKTAARLSEEININIMHNVSGALEDLRARYRAAAENIKEITSLGMLPEIEERQSAIRHRINELTLAKSDSKLLLKYKNEKKEITENNLKLNDKITETTKILSETTAKIKQLMDALLLSSKKTKFAGAAIELEMLRKDLDEGDACPLCGSIEHPGIIPQQYELLKKQEADLEDTLEEARLEERKLEFEMESAKSKLLNNADRLGVLTKEIKLIIASRITEVCLVESCNADSFDEIFAESKIKLLDEEVKVLNDIKIKIGSLASLSVMQEQLKGQADRLKAWELDWKKLASDIGSGNENETPDSLLEFLKNINVKKTDYRELESYLNKNSIELNSLKATSISQTQNLEIIENLVAERLASKKNIEKIKIEVDLEVTKIPVVNDPRNVVQNENNLMTRWFSEIKAKRVEVEKLRVDGKTLNTQIEEDEKAIIEAGRIQNFESIEAILAANLQPEEEKKLIAQRDELTIQNTRLTTELNLVTTELEMLALKDNENKTIEDIENSQGTCSKLVSALLEKKGALNLKIYQDSDAQKNYAVKIKEIENKKTAASPYFMLNDMIGDSQGKRFNEYAQELTLRRLLLAANSNLAGMHSRYELDMPEPKEDGNSLYVIDRDLGNTRRAADITLSGGESFMVSLALALGLSDLAAGKAELGNLFIDEGFGSLDPDTLELAIGVLEEIQHKRGRVIGIISHVTELKDRINTQIRIEKKAGGMSSIIVA